MTYPGGKNGAGVAQRIINQMPPHRTFIELCLGSGAVLRKKRPANRNIGIDRSRDALDLCLKKAASFDGTFHLIEGDALELLPSLGTMMGDRPFVDDPDTLIYADPPYLMNTRKGGAIYDFEMTDADHIRLLELLRRAPSMVMISGYRSALYDDALSHFRRIDYQAQTRQGPVEECLWMSFPEPRELHDYRFLGDDFRARDRIKKKRRRWAARLAKMDRLERLAITDELLNGDHTRAPPAGGSGA